MPVASAARFFPIAQEHGKARNALSTETYEQARWLALNVTCLDDLDIRIFTQPTVFLHLNIAHIGPQDNALF